MNLSLTSFIADMSLIVGLLFYNSIMLTKIFLELKEIKKKKKK